MKTFSTIKANRPERSGRKAIGPNFGSLERVKDMAASYRRRVLDEAFSVSVLIIISMIASPMVIAASSAPLVDTAKLEDGIVTLSYSADARLKVIVEKDGQQMIYDLRNDGKAESFRCRWKRIIQYKHT